MSKKKFPLHAAMIAAAVVGPLILVGGHAVVSKMGPNKISEELSASKPLGACFIDKANEWLAQTTDPQESDFLKAQLNNIDECEKEIGTPEGIYIINILSLEDIKP